MNRESPHEINEDAIEAVAAAWLVEREEGFTPERAESFQRWRKYHPRHAAAVARLEETDRLLKNLPRLRDDPQLSRRLVAMTKPRTARVVRFPVFKLMAAAAAVALAALWWWPGHQRFEQSFATTSEGSAKVTLPDHSFVELGGFSDIAVKYSPRERDVTLVKGGAHFSVAKDPSRPFIVAAGAIRVRAVGTAFDVRMADAAIEVIVTEGKVRVTRSDATALFGENDAYSELVAGERIEIASGAGSMAMKGPNGGSEQQAPSSARLVFEATPLAKVIQEFNRHNRIQLVVDDPELADRPVGGSFQADNVDAFVRLLESTGEISAERTYDSTIVLSKGN